MADMMDSKSIVRKGVRVQVPPPALKVKVKGKSGSKEGPTLRRGVGRGQLSRVSALRYRYAEPQCSNSPIKEKARRRGRALVLF